MISFLEAAEMRLQRATELLSLEPEMVEFLQRGRLGECLSEGKQSDASEGLDIVYEII